jgi:hypothetical protein
MFFHLSSDKSMNLTAYLSDINEELIKAYKVVKDNVEELIENPTIQEMMSTLYRTWPELFGSPSTLEYALTSMSVIILYMPGSGPTVPTSMLWFPASFIMVIFYSHRV